MRYVYRSRSKRLAAFAVDAVGYALTRPLRRGVSAPADPRRILIVRLDHLGDILLTTGLPKVLKEMYPLARVDVLVPSWGAPLFDNNPFVDEVLCYDAPWFAGRRFKRSAGSPSLLALIGKLRGRRYQIGLSLRGDVREHLILRLAGVSYTLGYGITGGGFLLSKVAPYHASMHELRRRDAVLRELGASHFESRPRLYIGPDEDPAALLRQLGVPDGVPLVGVQTGAGASSKEWSDETFMRFIAQAGRALPRIHLVLVGTRPRPVPPEMAERIHDLTGQTGIRQMCVLIRGLRAFVGYDSGPTHIASALDVPTLFLYSGVNCYDQWRPLVDSARTLRQSVACSPCDRTVCPVAGHPCMEGIDPGLAAATLKEMLA